MLSLLNIWYFSLVATYTTSSRLKTTIEQQHLGYTIENMHLLTSLTNYLNFTRANFVALPTHALLYSTIACMAGICWAHNGYYALLHVAPIAICLLSIKLRKTIGIIIAVSFYGGALLYSYKIHKQEAFYKHVEKQKIALQATVESIEAIENPRFNFRISLCLNALKILNTFEPCAKNSILLYVRTANDLQIDDEIELTNITLKKNTKESFNIYLLKEGYIASLFLENFEYKIIRRPSWTVNKAIANLKDYTLQEVGQKMQSDAFTLFSSLFLGNRTCVKKEMETTKEHFKIWGVSHYLARSGLHLVIFVLIWNFILGLVPLAYFLKQCLITMLILIYALLSWSSVSFERALLMFLLYKFCLAHRVSIFYVHLITLTTILILIINPLELFFLDFQLSFGLTFALAWFNGIQAEKRRLAF